MHKTEATLPERYFSIGAVVNSRKLEDCTVKT
jgi:hypothetical protein